MGLYFEYWVMVVALFLGRGLKDDAEDFFAILAGFLRADARDGEQLVGSCRRGDG